MIATFHILGASDHYLLNQHSMRHPNDDYLHPGVEPHGVWWNPSGLLNFSDRAQVNAKDFHRLYHGFDPVTGEKLTRTAGSKNRFPGINIVLNADKSVSTLWAIAPPTLRAKLECAPRPNHPRNHLIQRTTTGSAPTNDLTPRHIRWRNESTDIDHNALLAAIGNPPQTQAKPTPATIQTLNTTLDQLPRNLPDIPVRHQLPYLVRTVSRITATALLNQPTLANKFECLIHLHSTYSGIPKDKL